MRIAITGAGGFIGSSLAQEALARGYEVSCLVRRNPAPAGCHSVPGDLLDETSLAALVESKDIVFHLAGLTRARNEREFLEANARGTERLAIACLRSKRPPGRIVLLSSQAVVGPSSPERPSVEEDPYAPLTRYARSKAEAEARLLRAAGGRIAVTIIRAPAVYGPRNKDFLRVFRMIKRAALSENRVLHAIQPRVCRASRRSHPRRGLPRARHRCVLRG